MWILCALIGLFQLIILLMLSGVLFSVAAVSRLMEVTVILIYPTVIFLLRQSANLIILIWTLLGPLTISAIAIMLMCPVTSKWCFQQIGTNLEGIISSINSRANSSINNMNLSVETI
nr:PREDICTED: uncharacterized protein LOC105670547 isoform X2 [Linepithema humile]